ncbi:MAG TPA: sigma-70 family RNA polymerase sigma factor [Terriglobales bacterium]|nr:sigma-70 family RNA polymerase sigma factor [Terriglobales bacterium]
MKTLAVMIQTKETRPWSSEVEEVFRTRYADAFRAAYRITGSHSDAEDVMQTLFLRLLRRAPEDQAVGNLGGYVYRAAINAALDVLRSRREGQCIPLQEDLQITTKVSPERMLESKETQVWLRGALADMNPRWAEIFILRYFDELDNREIARMLHISNATVAVTLYRVRRLLERDFKTRMGVSR